MPVTEDEKSNLQIFKIKGFQEIYLHFIMPCFIYYCASLSVSAEEAKTEQSE